MGGPLYKGSFESDVSLNGFPVQTKFALSQVPSKFALTEKHIASESYLINPSMNRLDQGSFALDSPVNKVRPGGRPPKLGFGDFLGGPGQTPSIQKFPKNSSHENIKFDSFQSMNHSPLKSPLKPIAHTKNEISMVGQVRGNLDKLTASDIHHQNGNLVVHKDSNSYNQLSGQQQMYQYSTGAFSDCHTKPESVVNRHASETIGTESELKSGNLMSAGENSDRAAPNSYPSPSLRISNPHRKKYDQSNETLGFQTTNNLLDFDEGSGFDGSEIPDENLGDAGFVGIQQGSSYLEEKISVQRVRVSNFVSKKSIEEKQVRCGESGQSFDQSFGYQSREETGEIYGPVSRGNLVSVSALQSDMHFSSNHSSQREPPKTPQSFKNRSSLYANPPPKAPSPRPNVGSNRYEKFYSHRKGHALDYEGELNPSGQPTGTGRLYFPFVDQLFYLGPFVSGKMHGHGKFFYTNQTLLYEGDVANDAWTGLGTKFHISGSKIYHGDFFDNQYNGNGILYYLNSNFTPKYKGNFTDGFMHGLGQFFDFKGKLLYSGGFEFDRVCCENEGKLYDGWSGRMVYKGGFEGGVFSGHGVVFGEGEVRVLEGGFRRGVLVEGKQFGEILGMGGCGKWGGGGGVGEVYRGRFDGRLRWHDGSAQVFRAGKWGVCKFFHGIRSESG